MRPQTNIFEYRIKEGKLSEVISGLYAENFFIQPAKGQKNCLEVKLPDVRDGKVIGPANQIFSLAKIIWDEDDTKKIAFQIHDCSMSSPCSPLVKEETIYQRAFKVIRPYAIMALSPGLIANE